MYWKDLIADLESELSGNFRETIMGMFKPPAYYDAWSLNHAMEVSTRRKAKRPNLMLEEHVMVT